MTDRPGDSVAPLGDQGKRGRRRLSWQGELLLAALPTATVLAVFGLVEAVTNQRLIFASLASSAFLIYLDPLHATNTVRTLVTAHLSAAILGAAADLTIGHGYASGAAAMVAIIALMGGLDVVHPPAVSTALAFALRGGDASDLSLFVLAVAVTASLVLLERVSLVLLRRFTIR